MTEKPADEATEKSVTDLEAEARSRARAAMANDIPEQRTRPGQPEVTRFRKPSSHRTLIVSLLSLAVLIALAMGGDHLLRALKQNPDSETEGMPSSADGTQNQRKNLGRDSNPFGLFTPGKEATTTDNVPSPAAQQPPAPPVLNKAAALTDSTENGGGTVQQQSSRASRSEPDAASATTSLSDNAMPSSASGFAVNTASPGVAKITSVRRLGLNPDLYIPVDRYIPCSMMRRFVSDVGGTISCLISGDVYSASNNVKLLPAGTLARGFYRTGALQHGRGRMFVIWTELRTPEPDSLQIPLIDTEATGPLGEAGIAGWIDSHFWQRFGNALMLSSVQDVAAAAAGAAPGKDRNTDYTENSRAAAAKMAKTALENSINIPPTMYLNQGDVISIMTGTDIDFSSVYQLRIN